MQRSLRNEMIVAFLVVAMLSFAVVFAILLSTPASDDRSQMTATSVAVSEQRADATATEVLATETSEPPTATPDATETSTPTTSPTSTSTDTPTLTRTSTSTDTPTVAPTQTSTRMPTKTLQPTRRPASTATPTATRTPVPSRTPTPSRTPSPTEDVLRVTQQISMQATGTAVQQIRIIQTRVMLLPTATSGILPTPTTAQTMLTATHQARSTPACDPPTGWPQYTVASGDTLFALSLAVNSTVVELQAANCLTNADLIETGDVLAVPRQPLRPVQSFIQSGADTYGELNAIGCIDSAVRITSPASRQSVSGTFTVSGSANPSDFLYYKIEIRPDWASVYNFYMDSRMAVIDGVLADVNAEIFDNGLHWLRLSVVDITAGIQPEAVCEIPLFFE